jgi:hypothetical protein
LAVNADVLPGQIAAGEAKAVTTGFGFTVTVTVAEPVHPDPEDPVTVYVVLLLGQTLTVVPLRLPGCHE